jgi:hypothetical protein
MEGPIQVKELGDMAAEIPVVHVSPKSDRLSSNAVWGSYLRFQGKPWIPKLDIIPWHTTWTPNLHYLESERGRYGACKEGLWIRKIWTRLSLWKPCSLLSQGRSRARQNKARLKAPLGYKYNPLGIPRGWPIHPFIIEPLTRRRSIRRKPTTTASPRVA